MRQASRLCLARNHRRKSCKVIILYSIFFFISAIFMFVGCIILFLAVKDELSLPCTRLAQCQLDGMVDEVEDVVFPGKADFCFCRMDVDIHKVGGHLKKQDPSRKLALHRGTLERHFHARHHGAVADIAAIDIEILHTAAGAAAAGLGDETPDPVNTLAVIHLHEVTAELPTQHGVSCAAELAVTGGDILQFAFADELEAHLGVAQGHMAHDVGHESTLAGILFEELHPGGRVEKEVTDPDGGADASRTRLDGLLFPALDTVEGSALVGLGAGEHFDAGHAGDRGQCFAAEAQRVDAGEVVFRPDLAGGMADEGRGDVFCLDAGAVVADLNQTDTARLDGDGDL